VGGGVFFTNVISACRRGSTDFCDGTVCVAKDTFVLSESDEKLSVTQLVSAWAESARITWGMKRFLGNMFSLRPCRWFHCRGGAT